MDFSGRPVVAPEQGSKLHSQRLACKGQRTMPIQKLAWECTGCMVRCCGLGLHVWFRLWGFGNFDSLGIGKVLMVHLIGLQGTGMALCHGAHLHTLNDFNSHFVLHC